MSQHKKNIETIAIHSGTHHQSGSGSIVPPLEPTTNFEHSESGYQEGDWLYTRKENPNRNQLEKVLAELEGGVACAAFSSGVAAITAVYMAMEKGAHILLPIDLYHGSRAIMESYSDRWGMEYDSVDMTDLEAFEKAFKPNTKLVLVETPSNPLLEVIDLRKVTEIAHNHGAIICADNTFATPYNTNPIEYGADLVMHSTSKFLGGHSDILGGAVIAAKEDELFSMLRQLQRQLGAVPSPRDCWLLTRSIRSFPYRMRGHNENALKIAGYLMGHPKVREVYYPGLEIHPGHQIARNQMRGFGGVISFLVDGDAEETLKVIAGSKIIRRATSLGGIESTWEHRRSSESEGSTTPENLIRFSVGLENVEDLIEDLEGALG